MALNLNGLVPATVLPMHADGSIDEAGLRSYIAWIARQGPVALAINVDTGEGPHLTHDEKIRVLRVVREVTELPIVAGIAGPSTDAAVRQARDFKAAGADALLVFPIPAYLSEPLDVRIPVQYHEAIAAAACSVWQTFSSCPTELLGCAVSPANRPRPSSFRRGLGPCPGAGRPRSGHRPGAPARRRRSPGVVSERARPRGRPGCTGTP